MKKHFLSLFYVVVVAALAVVGVVFAQSGSDESRVRNIAGGSEIEITATPWQVSMMSIDPDSADANPTNSKLWRVSGCGGSIIAPTWILTADHCVQRGTAGALRPEYQLIGVGNKDYWDSLESPFLYRVSAIYPARQNRDGVDLLLLKLSTPIVYSDTARPIALPIAMDAAVWPAPGTDGLISGWGQILGGSQTTKLRAVSSPIIDSPTSSVCTDQWGISRYEGTYSSQRHICVLGATFTGASAGACPGDSGGPIAVDVDGTPTLAGVASMALGIARADGSVNKCSGLLPNLYARLRSHIDWVLPGPPQNLQVTVSDTNATISWAPASRVPALVASDYVIELRVKGSRDFATVNDGLSNNTTASLSGLQMNTEYEFRVAGVNDVNADVPANRMYSEVATFTVGTSPPTVPANSSSSTSTTTSTTSTTTTTLAPPPTSASPQTSIVTVPERIVKGAPDLPTFEDLPAQASPSTTLPARPQQSEVHSPPRSPIIGASMTSTDVARLARISVPVGSQVAVVVARGSAKICSSNGAVVKFKATGKCKVGISVRSGGKQSKPVKATISVKRK